MRYTIYNRILQQIYLILIVDAHLLSKVWLKPNFPRPAVITKKNSNSRATSQGTWTEINITQLKFWGDKVFVQLYIYELSVFPNDTFAIFDSSTKTTLARITSLLCLDKQLL